jgi:hypothetical protein
MKRGTTPTLPIKIKMPFSNVKSIEFIFKKDVSEYSNALLYKAFENNIPVKEQSDIEFVVELSLTAEETMRLSVGDVYMDTRIILTGDLIPETKIIKVNINDTLFRQVYEDD